ncbi:MAG: GNAT family protein [Bacteroidota bacterium]|nr:GNAT family protein [Bacteroidota bacterium]
MINLESDLLKLRAPELSDIDVLYKWENDQSLWEVSNTISPISKLLLKEYIKKSHLDIYQVKQLRLMIDIKENDGLCPVGCVDIFDFDPHNQKAGLGIIVDTNHRNKGIASETLILTIDYGFATLDLHQLYCNILENNEASLHLFEQMGFEIIGLKKDWIKTKEGWLDEYLLQKIRGF